MINLVKCSSKNAEAKFIGKREEELGKISASARRFFKENIFRPHSYLRRTKFFSWWELERKKRKRTSERAGRGSGKSFSGRRNLRFLTGRIWHPEGIWLKRFRPCDGGSRSWNL